MNEWTKKISLRSNENIANNRMILELIIRTHQMIMKSIKESKLEYKMINVDESFYL